MASSNLVGNLFVHTDERGQDESLPPTSHRYRCVEAILHMALCVLETPRGRDTLAEVGKQLVTERNNSRTPGPLLFQGSLSQMHKCVDHFLQKIRATFPYVYLVYLKGEAAAQKLDWGGSDLAQYDPQAAVYLSVNRTIVNNMIYAMQQSSTAGTNYKRFKFQMVISLAHEIIHCFTGYLTGNSRALTPETISMPGFTQGIAGESGRYWENLFFGGAILFYKDSNDPLGTRQAGIPYLVSGAFMSSEARRVSEDYIINFLSGSSSVLFNIYP